MVQVLHVFGLICCIYTKCTHINVQVHVDVCYTVTVIERKDVNRISVKFETIHVDCFMLLYATLLFRKLTLHGIKVLQEFNGKRLLNKGN